jgi:arsenite-transporting ATPase
VSTDPASNVGQVFDLTVRDTISEISNVPGLDALEIDVVITRGTCLVCELGI